MARPPKRLLRSSDKHHKHQHQPPTTTNSKSKKKHASPQQPQGRLSGNDSYLACASKLHLQHAELLSVRNAIKDELKRNNYEEVSPQRVRKHLAGKTKDINDDNLVFLIRKSQRDSWKAKAMQEKMLAGIERKASEGSVGAGVGVEKGQSGRERTPGPSTPSKAPAVAKAGEWKKSGKVKAQDTEEPHTPSRNIVRAMLDHSPSCILF